VVGTGGADVVVYFTGRSRKVGILSFLSSVAWIVGLVLLVSSPGELLESVRFRHYFDDDEEPAWFYLVFAGSSGLWRGGIQPVLVRQCFDAGRGP
jgi:hypothetical protein